MTAKSPRQRLAQQLVTGIDRHNLHDLERRLNLLIHIDETAGINRIDGYPTRTPGNGATTGTTGRTITVTDEHGQPDQIPVTGVEADMLARLEHRNDRDPYHSIVTSVLKHLGSALEHLNAAVHDIDRADNLRSTADLEFTPQCWLASHYKMPVDATVFAVHVRTAFEGYLTTPWDEPRPVCRFVYDFTRQYGRLPTKDEMERRAQGRRVHIRDHRPASVARLQAGLAHIEEA